MSGSAYAGDDMAHVLTELVMNSKELAELEARLAQFNIFRILKADQHEIRHSNMLAWLLDPAEAHGLEDYFLRRWLMEFMYAAFQNGSDRPWISPIVVDAARFLDVTVRREWKNIDLLIELDTEWQGKWVICIENKVNSRQSTNQLARYRTIVEKEFPDASERIYVFLTKSDEAPDDGLYLTSSYEDIARVLDRCLSERKDAMGAEPLLLIEHYQQLLREDFMEDNESTRLAREIYKRHSRAIDFILESKLDPIFELTNLLEQYFRMEAQALGIVMSRTGKGRIRFIPAEWDTEANSKGHAWGAEGHYICVELDLYIKTVELSMIAGRTPAEFADRLWEACAVAPLQRSQQNQPKAFLKAYRARSPYRVQGRDDIEPESMAAEIFEWAKGEMAKDDFKTAQDKITPLLDYLN